MNRLTYKKCICRKRWHYVLLLLSFLLLLQMNAHQWLSKSNDNSTTSHEMHARSYRDANRQPRESSSENSRTLSGSSASSSVVLLQNKSDSFKESNLSILIYSYDSRNYQTRLDNTDCGFNFQCTVTYDGHSDNLLKDINHYDGISVMGHLGLSRFSKKWQRSSKVRRRDQIWMAVSLESSRQNSDFKIENIHVNHLFNWSAGLSRNADMERSYINVYTRSKARRYATIKQEYVEWNKTMPFCWMVSNCATVKNNRSDIVKELMNYLDEPLHFWGTGVKKCVHTKNKEAKFVDHK
ncbi:uncharacterized protein LOC142356189, partial [Convolutriloba macropyga]|uniref:uncharacterized protein LOC142356189 n=1 Tax=Convolutriloba macropyga TaxID=536237 RepID=UPI003F527942